MCLHTVVEVEIKAKGNAIAEKVINVVQCSLCVVRAGGALVTKAPL